MWRKEKKKRGDTDWRIMRTRVRGERVLFVCHDVEVGDGRWVNVVLSDQSAGQTIGFFSGLWVSSSIHESKTHYKYTLTGLHNIYIYIYIYIYLSIYIYVCMYVYVCVCGCTYMYMYIRESNSNVCYVCMCISLYVHMYMYMYMYMWRFKRFSCLLLFI